MHENDPSLLASILGWIASAVLTIALAFGTRAYSRALQKQDASENRVRAEMDEIEKRVRDLEKDSVTHEDLRRIETKMDEQNQRILDKLERILERNSKQ